MNSEPFFATTCRALVGVLYEDSPKGIPDIDLLNPTPWRETVLKRAERILLAARAHVEHLRDPFTIFNELETPCLRCMSYHGDAAVRKLCEGRLLLSRRIEA